MKFNKLVIDVQKKLLCASSLEMLGIRTVSVTTDTSSSSKPGRGETISERLMTLVVLALRTLATSTVKFMLLVRKNFLLPRNKKTPPTSMFQVY